MSTHDPYRPVVNDSITARKHPLGNNPSFTSWGLPSCLEICSFGSAYWDATYEERRESYVVAGRPTHHAI
jgi:hypothetical protein